MTALGKYRLAAGLGLVAAVLAGAAAVVAYVRRGEMEWSLIAATVFLLAMAWGSWQRSRPGGSQ